MHQATRKEFGAGSRKDLGGSADDRGKNRLDKIYVAGPPTSKKNELKVIKLQNKDIAYSARKAHTKLSKDIMVAGEDQLPEQMSGEEHAAGPGELAAASSDQASQKHGQEP